MDTAEVAAKLRTLEDDVSAKSSRIAELEARVSLLEAENTRLRKAMPKGEAMDRTGNKGPAFGRLEKGLGGNYQKRVGMMGGRVVYDVIEVSDGEEEGMAVDVHEATGVEEGVLAVPTPRKCAGQAATVESDDEDEIEESGGGDHGSIHCDDNVGLEDDDVSITPRGKKRTAARVIASDSEDEDGNDKDGEVQEEEVGVTPSRKRVLRGVSDSDSEDGSEDVRVVSPEHASDVPERGIESEDDDGMPIREWVKKMREERDEGEFSETKGCSTPATRRSARLVESQSKRVCNARRVLDFVEPKDYEGSEDDSEEDDGMDEFIDDADCLDNCADSDEESSAEPEECYSEPNYEDVMAQIRGKRKAKSKDWASEPEMLSAFAEHPELCLKAVCALYRKQTEEEKTEKATFVHNKKGFNPIDAPRGSLVAEFLLDGDAFGPLKKTADDLKKYDLEFCEKMALRYSKQLFAIYQKKEDPYFP